MVTSSLVRDSTSGTVGILGVAIYSVRQHGTWDECLGPRTPKRGTVVPTVELR